MAAKDAVGRHGEEVVARALVEQGWQILARNWRCATGELDIVARDGGDAVALEVKTRRSVTFGSPLEAVTRVKVARLRRLAALWLASQDGHFDGVRIDVVGVTLPRSGAAVLTHLKGVE